MTYITYITYITYVTGITYTLHDFTAHPDLWQLRASECFYGPHPSSSP